MRLLTIGEDRREAAPGYWVHVVPYSSFVRAEQEQASAPEHLKGSALAAALLREGCRDEAGELLFEDGEDPRDVLGMILFMRLGAAIVELNTAGDVEGKSDAAPGSGSPSA